MRDRVGDQTLAKRYCCQSLFARSYQFPILRLGLAVNRSVGIGTFSESILGGGGPIESSATGELMYRRHIRHIPREKPAQEEHNRDMDKHLQHGVAHKIARL